MAKLLHIESSPRKDRSASIEVAREFLKIYAEAHPKDTIETLDLWSYPLPEFDGAAINAKYSILHGQPHSPEEAKAWEGVRKVFDRFNDADKYVFSVPMWNFGIPYKLKHFIDVIVQPGLAFSFSPETGFTGLVAGKPAVVISARGGEYSSNARAKAVDFEKPYVDLLLGFIGFKDIRSILVEPTLGAPEQKNAAVAAAKEQAAKIAREF
jgi:FMN-dependent NADH-azoreductase